MAIRPRVLLALGCALLTAGCANSSEMSFRQDKRLKILSPSTNKTVRLPVTVSWTMRDFTAVRPGSPVRAGTGYYAIFLDKYPMARGKGLDSLVKNGDCAGVAGCPDAGYLAERLHVFVTSRTSYTINSVPSSGTLGSSSHYLTVILIDGAGRRIGDSAWTTSFTVKGAAS